MHQCVCVCVCTFTGVSLSEESDHQGGAVCALSGAGEGLDAQLVSFGLWTQMWGVTDGTTTVLLDQVTSPLISVDSNGVSKPTLHLPYRTVLQGLTWNTRFCLHPPASAWIREGPPGPSGNVDQGPFVRTGFVDLSVVFTVHRWESYLWRGQCWALVSGGGARWDGRSFYFLLKQTGPDRGNVKDPRLSSPFHPHGTVTTCFTNQPTHRRSTRGNFTSTASVPWFTSFPWTLHEDNGALIQWL